MNNFFEPYINKALSYKEYRELIDRLVSEGKTTGPNQTEKLCGITKLNIQRMNRIDKTVTVLPELSGTINSFERKCIWLVIAEAWCGDVAQNLPVINKIAESTGCVDLKIVLRDENPELIDRYLTNGGRSIPKLICIDAGTMEEICTWGPRPRPAQEMMREHKENPVKEESEVLKDIQLWYAHDKGVTVQKEIMKLIQKCGAKESITV
jgi:hypothetical protein